MCVCLSLRPAAAVGVLQPPLDSMLLLTLLPPHAIIVSPPPSLPPFHNSEGKNIRPQKALKMGLVDQLVDPASLEAVAVAAAASLADGSLKPKRKKKALMNRAIEDTPVGRNIMWKKVRVFVVLYVQPVGALWFCGWGGAPAMYIARASGPDSIPGIFPVRSLYSPCSPCAPWVRGGVP